jgi:hypothetical protein
MFKFLGSRKKQPSTGAAEESPLSDEQIEAEHFPGVIPRANSDVEMPWETMALCPGEDQWMARNGDGFEVLVTGGLEQPGPSHLSTAKLAFARFAEVRTLSIRLLQSFVHEPGSWSFDELNVGKDADHNRCDFQTALSFSPNDGSDSYGYTSFVVCFRITEGSRKHHLHPFKTVIEFL